ncbi:MAG: RHH-type proline utilization regulon transcriptional repressor/proline dehydrogenase [Arenicella sp.]|jgi:RHH-type proline utilization regulon transcriptional repressor/proline dehydrogenase/delta 1-pyrroline-5-carboxylate dehydrogenase
MSAFDASPILSKQILPSPILSKKEQTLTSEQWFERIVNHYAISEDELMAGLCLLAEPDQAMRDKTEHRARGLIDNIRSQGDSAHAIDKLLQEYSLDNEEGVILMCLVEALIRIPDAETAAALIRDKLSAAAWDKHLGRSESLLVNASTWGLMLTRKVVNLGGETQSASNLLSRLVKRAGEPVIRKAMNQAMRIMGKQFVLGRDINEALKHSKSYRAKGYTYSFDMLGEAAFTDADAERYYQSYLQAAQALASSVTKGDKEWRNDRPPPSISIKLSALFPRYEEAHQAAVMSELYQRVLSLIKAARQLNIAITIDAEEADRLELSLRLFTRLYQHQDVQGWGLFGLAVQAYSKRALPVLGYLTSLAHAQGDQIPIRLVKGAYWDTEIKHAQQLGLADYPVFTRKENTDVSYMACARYLLSHATDDCIYPQFASHNAHTVAAVIEMAQENPSRAFEFQRLHGMGDTLYDALLDGLLKDMGAKQKTIAVRIYAPVGAHKNLLPYLVRRLLENGANSSFVHRLGNPNTAIKDLITSPITQAQSHSRYRNLKIPRPGELFTAIENRIETGAETGAQNSQRQNSQGYNIAVESEREPLLAEVQQFSENVWTSQPIISGQKIKGCQSDTQLICSPYNHEKVVGELHWASAEQAQQALQSADQAWFSWNTTSVIERAACLERTADLLEKNRAELIALCTYEAGKTLQDGIDEIREAVDFCRYYAQNARQDMLHPTQLPGPTGESNEHYYAGRGTFLCISPWNFPLAIFLGQISAALVTGNCVLAKPAQQTSLIAGRTIELMHQAGIPDNVLHFLPGAGATIGDALLSEDRLAGIAFTGSIATAKHINLRLAQRNGAIPTFIAETGGQNAMIVDSTSLPEQVVTDVMASAFSSAGQRCSALRILYVQEDIADRVIELISGALQHFVVGNPEHYATDCGPVIDRKAQQELLAHCEYWQAQGKLLAQASNNDDIEGRNELAKGFYVLPTVIAIDSISELQKEQFGPILHICRFQADELEHVINDINKTGYGLTLGIHSRNETTAAYIEARVRVGNCYINRNQIGAVVGVQPFGGRGLSGTGPKAGGPNYLKRFATERVRTINTTAIGGNTSLL